MILQTSLKFIFFILIHLTKGELRHEEGKIAAEPHRIAIIGGGIGGAATAYFLHQLTSGGALIDVYESGQVGGRLATAPLAAKYYETGGSVLHPSNAYMEQFVKELGLSHSLSCSGSAGLFDGSEFVLRDSSWQVVSLARLFWRYGWDVYKLHSINEDMLQKFNKIYSLQSRGFVFANTSSLLAAMDASFPGLTEVTTREHLLQLGLSARVVDELVTAVTLCNYGQTPGIHAFVGSIAVAGASPKLWSIAGGNRQVPELLLAKSRASVLRRHATVVTVANTSHQQAVFQVSSVEASPGGSVDLTSEGRNYHYRRSQDPHADDERTQEYDAVVLATPLTSDKTDLKFVNTSAKLSFPGHFERIVATLVQGTLRKATFKLPDADDIDEILVVNPDLIYNSIGLQHGVDDETCSSPNVVYKVFSPKPLTNEQLQLLFSEVVSSKIVDWRAYPHYTSGERQEGRFVLQPGLYHLNAIEWVGSAMEMSAIAAKNIALLVIKYLTGDENAGNSSPLKDEL